MVQPDINTIFLDALLRGIDPFLRLAHIPIIALVVWVGLTILLNRSVKRPYARPAVKIAVLPTAIAFFLAGLTPSVTPLMIFVSGLSICCAILVAVVGYFQANIRGAVGERRALEFVKDVGFTTIADIYLPGKSGPTQIDQIVRAGDVIVVVEIKNYSGNIRGSATAKQWTAWYGNSAHRFQNPIHQNYGHVQAVRQAMSNECVVMGVVVFVGSAKFSGQRPEGVLLLSELRRALQKIALANPATAHGLQQWERLCGLAKMHRTKDTKALHLELVKSMKLRRPTQRVEPRF